MTWLNYTGEAWGVVTFLFVLRFWRLWPMWVVVWIHLHTNTLQPFYGLYPLPWGMLDLTALFAFAYLWFRFDDRVALACLVLVIARLFVHAAQHIAPQDFFWYATAVVACRGGMLICIWNWQRLRSL